ncbi:transcriptional regulator [Jiangella anatolica]|uniref:Transcriptional regulator n=1 Tax=Jiangella anatolica TaxID=2670374 RepID=A0A2W2B5H7_9ACTN|nr:transcriptional regulator [Jiangella anatolica]PZF80290.1 transcriptional regulator [Jiangella anatolica]
MTTLLVLHAVRLRGFAETPDLAARFGLDPAEAAEALEDARARGWVTHAEFAGLGGWSLTESGRAENERLLAAELTEAGAAAEVEAVHAAFLPLNARLLRAVTDWQLGAASADAGARAELAAVGAGLAPLAARLSAVRPRFGGYDTRFAAALDDGRIDDTDADSCHRVWFELHEDLVATLGLSRE